MIASIITLVAGIASGPVSVVPAAPGVASLQDTDLEVRLEEVRELVDRAREAAGAGDQAAARGALASALEGLDAWSNDELGAAQAAFLVHIANLASSVQGIAVQRAALERIIARRERILSADDLELLSARNELGAALMNLRELREARAIFSELVPAFDRVVAPDHPMRIRALLNLGTTTYQLGEVDHALEVLEEVVALSETAFPPDHVDRLRAQLNLGIILQNTGQLDRARTIEEAVLEGYERTFPADHFEVNQARVNLAATLRDLNDFEGARLLLERAIESFEQTLPPEHPALLMVRRNLAISLTELGEFERALAIKEQVLAEIERALPDDHPDAVGMRMSLSVTLLAAGELDRALRLLEEVVETYARIFQPDHEMAMKARQNLALVLKRLGYLERARSIEEDLVVMRGPGFPDDHPSAIAARNNLAGTRFLMGDLEGAHVLFEEVLGILERTLPSDHPDLLVLRHNYALTLGELGDPEAGLAINVGVLEALERALPHDHSRVLYARGRLANSLLDLEQNAEARAIFEQVRDVQEKSLPPNHPDRLRVLQNLSIALGRLGELDAARAIDDEVLAMYEGNLPPGHRDLQAAHLSRVMHMLSLGPSPELRVPLQRMIASLFARFEASQVRSPREMRAVAADTSGSIGTLLSLSDDIEGWPELAREAFEVAETHRVVATSTTSMIGGEGEDPELDALRSRALALRNRLNDLVAARWEEDEEDAQRAGDLSRTALERDRVEARIRAMLVAKGALLRRIEIDRIASGLPEGAVAVGYLRYPEDSGRGVRPALIAQIVRRDGALARVELGLLEEVSGLVERWRAAIGQPVLRGMSLQEPASDAALEAGEALRARVLDPVIEASGLGDELQSLYLCLDDVLHLVTLDAMPLGDGFVGDRYRIRNEVSFARLASPAPAELRGRRFLSLVGASFNAGQKGGGDADHAVALATAPKSKYRSAPTRIFGPLRQTRYEAENLAELYKEVFDEEAVVLTGEGASKAALHEHASSARWLHLATHGYFAPESLASSTDVAGASAPRTASRMRRRIEGLAPMALCGLALAGANRGRDRLGRVPGILTAEELAGIDLSGCELAVLSACETHVGIRRAGLGVRSLQAALQAAGARSSITSLWKVDDAWTRELMEDFYTRLWVHGEPKADALWSAKQALHARGAGLRDWAAWVLMGDPN